MKIKIMEPGRNLHSFPQIMYLHMSRIRSMGRILHRAVKWHPDSRM